MLAELPLRRGVIAELRALTRLPYAKSISALAAALVGCAVGMGILSSHAAETVSVIYPHLYAAARAIGATAFGRLAVLVVLVLLVDLWFLGWRASSLFRLLFNRSKSAILDILYAIVLTADAISLAQIALTFGASLLASKCIAWVTIQYGWSRIALPATGTWEILISFAIYWLATSFVQYWGHRLVHTPLFWHLHRFHHAATELNVLTTFRQHPLEPVVLGFLSLVSPLIFFNVPQRVLLLYFFIGTISDLLAHSQLSWEYGWIGRWVVQSPRFHQVHHSIEEEHHNSNFSNCPLWDRVFGTWYKGTKAPSQYGIADPAYEQRPLTQFVLDTWIFYANLARAVASPFLAAYRRRRDKAPNGHAETINAPTSWSIGGEMMSPLPPAVSVHRKSRTWPAALFNSTRVLLLSPRE